MRFVRSTQMHIVEGKNIYSPAHDEEAEAERYARMMDEIFLDEEDMDPVACPPDRRFYLDGKQAWIYEHGNICELVFIRES